MSRHNRWWQVFDAEENGLGLIEVMVAIFVLAVSLLALASVGVSSLASLRVTRDREQATNAASAAIEAARSRDFGGLALAPGSVEVSSIPPGAFPPGSSDACFDGEPVVTDGAAVNPVPFTQSAGNGGRIQVHTVVTYAEATCSPATTSDLKRVTAIASWTDGGVTRFVQQDTLVVAAGRGLPVPKFEVRPPASSLGVSKAFLTDADISDKNRCIEHQLRNLGAEDSYDWELEGAIELDAAGAPVTPEASVSAVASGDGYLVGDWKATAYLEFPAVESREGAPPPTTVDRMSWAGGVPRPASDARVEPAETATLTVCYEPASGTVVPPDDWPGGLEITIAVRSRFDDRQVRRLEHHLTVRDQAGSPGPGTPAGTPYHLFDWDDATAHPRTQPKPGPPNAGSPVLLPLLMGPLAPAGSSPELPNHLGTINYADATKSNWSTDVAADRPGVQLSRATAAPTASNRELSSWTAAWHRQMPAATVLLAPAELVVWSAPVSALGAAPPAGGSTVALEIRVDRLHKNESNVQWSLPVINHTYQHVDAGWQRLEIPIDLGAERNFAKDEYLRLRITCAPTNAEDCNLAYDNVTYPSALFVQVK